MLEEVGRYVNGYGETVVIFEDGSVVWVDFRCSKVSVYPINSNTSRMAREQVGYEDEQLRDAWAEKGLL